MTGPRALQFGAVIRLPSGDHAFEPYRSLIEATYEVRSLNRAIGADPGARVAYREVTFGEWSDSPDSPGADGEWGVRRTWRDGYTEESRAPSRHDAERAVRIANRRPDGQPTAVLVFRTVTFGDWWLAE